MRTAMRLAAVVGVAAILFQAERAWAPFHLVVIDQVFPGTADCPNAQYVMMRMLLAGMQFINGQKVPVQNADGSAAGEFGTFGGNAPHGMAGDAFIMGTRDAATLFGIAMDQETSGALVLPDGRVCFGFFGNAPVDCLAYGGYSGDNSGGGTPAVAPQLGMAWVRQSNTMDDMNDFVLAAPMPRNNAGDVGTLGQCGGAQPTPTDTPVEPTATDTPVEPTATETQVEATPTARPVCVGDCDGTGMVTVGNLITGVNIALGNQQVDACPSFDIDGDGMVSVSELIQAVTYALSGCP
jgi:hypothetical protein